AEDGIRDDLVTGVQTCALPIWMYMRFGFAIAAHIDADILLLDEVFAVGDEQFQRKCFGKVFEFKQRGGTIVFVSHDTTAIERLRSEERRVGKEGRSGGELGAAE